MSIKISISELRNASEAEQAEFKLSDNQKSAVDEARQQIREGNSFTNDDVNKEIGEWLTTSYYYSYT